MERKDITVNAEKRIIVESVVSEFGLLTISSTQGLLLINNELCSHLPIVGDIVCFTPSKVTTNVNEKEVWLGVTSMTVERSSNKDDLENCKIEAKILNEQKETSLRCLCQTLSCIRCPAVSCDDSLSLSPPVLLKISQESAPYSPRGTIGIRDVVEKVGGCSSSPLQSSFY